MKPDSILILLEDLSGQRNTLKQPKKSAQVSIVYLLNTLWKYLIWFALKRILLFKYFDSSETWIYLIRILKSWPSIEKSWWWILFSFKYSSHHQHCQLLMSQSLLLWPGKESVVVGEVGSIGSTRTGCKITEGKHTLICLPLTELCPQIYEIWHSHSLSFPPSPSFS